MKTVEIANLQDYKNLQLVNKLNSEAIERASIKQQTNLFTIATSAQNLHKLIKKSELSEETKKSVLSTISKIANTVNGILETADIKKSDVKPLIKKLKSRVSKIESTITSHIDELYKSEVSAITFEDVQKLTASTTAETKKEIDKAIDSNLNLIKTLQHHSQTLPTSKSEVTSTFRLAKLPIVAISNLTSEDFKSGGFAVEKLGAYSILKDQLVIGINPESAEGGLTNYLKMVVNSLSHKTNDKYIIMPNSVSYKTSGLLYFWIVPEKEADRLLHNTGKSFSVNKWGFAFK